MRCFERYLLHRKFAVSFNRVGYSAALGPTSDFFVESFGEAVELRAIQRESRSHGMATEFADEVGGTRCHRVEHIANVESGHRVRGVAEGFVALYCESDYRTSHSVFYAARDEANDTLMPCLVIQT